MADPVALATPRVTGRAHPEWWSLAPGDWRVSTFDHWLPNKVIEKIKTHLERRPRKVACLLLEGEGDRFRVLINLRGAVSVTDRPGI